MNDAAFTAMQTYAKSLDALGLAVNSGVVALRQAGDRVDIGKRDTAFALLSPDDITHGSIAETNGEFAEILRIFAARPDLSGLFLLASPFGKRVSETVSVMRASLDDTAQIAGGRIRTAASPSAADALPCIRRNFGCFIKGFGMLTVGRSLHEAYVAALVLEKGARAEVQGAAFGGAKPLGAFDCLLMRNVYLKKYSKIQEQSL